MKRICYYHFSICNIPKEFFEYWLSRLVSGDIESPEYRKMIADIFINSIYVVALLLVPVPANAAIAAAAPPIPISPLEACTVTSDVYSFGQIKESINATIVKPAIIFPLSFSLPLNKYLSCHPQKRLPVLTMPHPASVGIHHPDLD